MNNGTSTIERPGADALGAYEDARADWYALAHALPLLRSQLAQARDDLEFVRLSTLAQERADGGRITGKNEADREAQLALILAELPQVAALRDELRRLTRAIEQSQAQIDDAANRMRGSRLAIELATANAYREAYAHGGPERPR